MSVASRPAGSDMLKNICQQGMRHKNYGQLIKIVGEFFEWCNDLSEVGYGMSLGYCLSARLKKNLDGEVWDALHIDAEKEGMKYQPFLNKLLRRILLNEKNDLEQRIEKLEAALIKTKAI